MGIFSTFCAVLIFLVHGGHFRTTGFVSRSYISGFDLQTFQPTLPSFSIEKDLLQTFSRGVKVSMIKEESSIITEVKSVDYFSVLISKTRDRNLLNIAIANLVKDPTFLKRSNSLALVSEALKNCRAPASQMLSVWKDISDLGVPITRQNIKNLLYYCYNNGKRDTYTQQSVLDTICTFDKAKYWNPSIFNLIIQMFTERLDDVYDKRNVIEKGVSLSEIVIDIISIEDSKIMDEKSIVMLMKYFSNIGDYKTLKTVFSHRHDAVKRPIAGQELGKEEMKQENLIIWNAHLSALVRFSKKERNGDQNVYTLEMNEVLATMLDLNLVDLYTLNIMLEYYVVKISENRRNDNIKKSEELIVKCLDIWDNKAVAELRESTLLNKSFEDIPRGVKISYSIMVRCLLLSDYNGITESKNNVLNNEYVKLAFKLALDVPSEEVVPSLLFTVGAAEEKSIPTTIGYMKKLNERRRLLSNPNSTEINNNEKNIIFNNNEEGKNKWNNKNKSVGGVKSSLDLSSIDHLDSLLSGYYDSLRYDLVIEAYLLANNNISEDDVRNFKSSQFEAFTISNGNVEGVTKAFNLFMASLKELIKIEMQVRKEEEYDDRSARTTQYDTLWKFSKAVLRERMAAEKSRLLLSDKNGENPVESGRSYLDLYSIVTAIDAANLVSDHKLAGDLFYIIHDSSTACASESQRIVQAYLRSFQSPSQLFELDKFFNSVISVAPQYKFLFTSYSSVNDADSRTFDEVINAYLRVGNLPIALEIASLYANKFSDSALRNLMIHFDRYWRDYENETIYLNDLLKGQERLERNHNKQMNEYLESNLQSGNEMIEKDYYSKEAIEFVRTPAAYVFLQDVTSRCMAVEAMILSDILSSRALQDPPLYVFWSTVVGVLVSRGDWDTAVDILNKMEASEKSVVVRNKVKKYEGKSMSFNRNKNTKLDKKLYKGSQISQTVELAVLYSLDGGLPLLTKNGEKALSAMDLKRLLSKENDNFVNGKEKYDAYLKVLANTESAAIGKVVVKAKNIQNLDSITHSLNKIPRELFLDAAEKRTVCTMGDVLGFLERCRGGDAEGDRADAGNDRNVRSDGIKGSGSEDNEFGTYDYEYVPLRKDFVKKKRVPVGIALLQSLFAAAINERKYKQAARIIRLLEGSRLVIDLDAPALVVPVAISMVDSTAAYSPQSLTSAPPSAAQSPSATGDGAVVNTVIRLNPSNSVANNPGEVNAVQIVRETLARRWAALLIGASLNKLKSNVAGSVKMMAALKYLQKEEIEKEKEKEAS